MECDAAKAAIGPAKAALARSQGEKQALAAAVVSAAARSHGAHTIWQQQVALAEMALQAVTGARGAVERAQQARTTAEASVARSRESEQVSSSYYSLTYS
jgi:hypothetical protein